MTTYSTFPTLSGQSYPFVRKPIWSTISLNSVSGKRVRYPNRNIPQYQYTLNFELLRSSSSYLEFQQLIGFYNLMQGSYGVFQFNDPNDYTATSDVIGTGDGSTKTFQLYRTFGGFTEPVKAPLTYAVYSNGTLVSSSLYSVSSTGAITFTTAPVSGAVLTWTGTFNWLCRFDDDSLEFSNFAYQLWELQKLSFTTEIL